jgi:hypothetical protein
VSLVVVGGLVCRFEQRLGDPRAARGRESVSL